MLAHTPFTRFRSRAATAKLHLARRLRAINGGAFLERNHNRDRAVLILGSGRSGTTWLAEVLARHAGSRLIFEPFHPFWTPGPNELSLFLGPSDSDLGMESLVGRILEGRTRKAPLGQIVITRRPAGRVIKDIHSGNLLPWCRSTFPEVPIVFALRHPIAVARSRQRHGDFYGLGRYLETDSGRDQAESSPMAGWLPAYDAHREHPDELVRLVAEWCIENAYPLSQIDEDGAILTYYETAIQDPVAEFGRLASFCGAALGQGGERLDGESLRVPSSKDFFGSIGGIDSNRDWAAVSSRWTTEVPAATAGRCVEVLADFGIDGHYGEDPLPLPSAT